MMAVQTRSEVHRAVRIINCAKMHPAHFVA